MEPELQSCDINAARYLFLNYVRLKKKLGKLYIWLIIVLMDTV